MNITDKEAIGRGGWQRFYDEKAKREEIYPRIEVGQFWGDIFMELPHPHLVADIGCGYGRMVEALDSLGIDGYMGVDFSGGEIARARRKYTQHKFEVCDIFELGTRFPASFDGFICNMVLMCLPRTHTQEAFRCIRKSLKPSAVGMLTTKRGNGYLDVDGLKLTEYDVNDVSMMARRSGFEIIDMIEDSVIVIALLRAV